MEKVEVYHEEDKGKRMRKRNNRVESSEVEERRVLPGHFYNVQASDISSRFRVMFMMVIQRQSEQELVPQQTTEWTREFLELLMKLAPADRSRIMRREKMRLLSFGKLWPIPRLVCPETLAKAGFYYTGIADRVQCAVCRGVLRNWEGGDIAWDEHKKHFGFCRFITGQDTSNTPADKDQETLLTIETLKNMLEAYNRGGDVGSGSFSRYNSGGGNSFGSGSTPASVYLAQNSFGGFGPNQLRSSGSGSDSAGPFNSGSFGQKSFEDLPSRQDSFPTSWSYPVAAKDLALAGFYSTEKQDEVKCFTCGLSLSDWAGGDNPMDEHKRFSADCTYVKEFKASINSGERLPSNGPDSGIGSMSADSIPSGPGFGLPRKALRGPEKIQEEPFDLNARFIKIQGNLVPAFVCPGCNERHANTINLPCGHMEMCEVCAKRVLPRDRRYRDIEKPACSTCSASTVTYAKLIDIMKAPPSEQINAEC